MIRKWDIPSAAGATNVKKSEGVIQDGTARTPSMTPSAGEGDDGGWGAVARNSSSEG